jgi:hypothetical protein
LIHKRLIYDEESPIYEFTSSNPEWGASTLPGAFDSHALPPFNSQISIFCENIPLS